VVLAGLGRGEFVGWRWRPQVCPIATGRGEGGRRTERRSPPFAPPARAEGQAIAQVANILHWLTERTTSRPRLSVCGSTSCN
jgi:glutathione S-transferase